MVGYGFAYNIGVLTDVKTGSADTEMKYGVKARSGDIVEMHCDMNRLELSFRVNGIDYGVAYKDIEKTEYRAAVNLCDNNAIVTLLE